jgi:hypothetical protein
MQDPLRDYFLVIFIKFYFSDFLADIYNGDL